MGTRKRRLPRLNYAAWTPHLIRIAPGDWQKMEQAIGHDLSKERRAKISKLANNYLISEGMERAAPFAQHEGKWLDDLRAVVTKFQEAIIEAPGMDRAARSGLAEVQIELNKILKAAYGRSCILSDICFLTSAIDAVASARDERPPGIEDGKCWQKLVESVKQKFTEWKLPTGLRKDSDKNKSDKPSKFASFFQQLQSCFPPEARRHVTQGISALTAAMSLALRRGTLTRRKSKDKIPPFQIRLK